MLYAIFTFKEKILFGVTENLILKLLNTERKIVTIYTINLWDV